MTDSLKDLEELLGNRQIAVAGELTKMYETVYRGTLRSARQHFQDQPARGEYTLVVAGEAKKAKKWEEAEVINAAQLMLQSDLPPSQAARQLARQSGWPRRKIYQILTDLQNADG